jgi:hypothetical protein
MNQLAQGSVGIHQKQSKGLFNFIGMDNKIQMTLLTNNSIFLLEILE